MDEHSRTAILVAVTRGMHAEMVEEPLLEDTIAPELYTEEEAREITELARATALSGEQERALEDSAPMTDVYEMAFRHGAFAASTIARNRYAEDCLEDAVERGSVGQYVIVGAGLDTFAFRRPDLAGALDVFELDHPASQRFKRERLEAAGLDDPDSLHFVPVDLTETTVSSALADTAFDPDRPAFYSWLGVTPYLPTEAVFATLESIAEASPAGSEVVFDFVDAVGSDPETTTPRIRRFMDMVDAMGEPARRGLPLEAFEADLARLGLDVVELLDPEEQRRRYFDDQPDYFRPTEHYHFARIEVRSK